MIELGVGADLFRLVGGVFWIVMLGALAAALLVPKSWTGKAIAVAAVVGLFAAFPGRWAWERKQTQDAYIAKRDKAMAIFNERCKSAGEKIYRTVEGVEGILLMKLRPKFDTSDQNAVDPFGNMGDLWGDAYILSFLEGRNEGGHLHRDENKHMGYRYVEAIDPADGKRYRYIGIWGRDPKWRADTASELRLTRQPSDGPSPRYGVTYEDLTTPEERAYWIAGSSLKVIDLETKEVLAERIGYMFDRGLGAKAGGRQPWAMAARWSCPYFYSVTPSRELSGWARSFTEQVLKIKGE